jgi:uncharacterized protein with ParB-like and HNH nuclease domain
MIRAWDIKRTTFSLGDFLSWQRAGTLELSPSFQRRSVWSKPQKSYFIDTIYRGLPVPIIFLRERTDVETLSTIREVIDGQQRLRTLLSYIAPDSLKDATVRDDFKIQKKHNPDIAERDFSELNDHEKTRILSYQFSVHVLQSDTSDAEVLSIFARMNSTGSKLNDQELRNAEFFGEFKLSCYEAALKNLERWRNWAVFSEQEIARMKEVEFTSVMFINIMDGLIERTQTNITKYYKEFDEIFEERKEVETNFSGIMNKIDDRMGAHISTSAFRNSSLFLQLFYLTNKLENENIPLTASRIKKIFEVGDRLKGRQELPNDVSVALASRFNRLSNQKIVASYIFDNVT